MRVASCQWGLSLLLLVFGTAPVFAQSSLLTGTAEIKESAERAAVFAVLDATNRWTEARRPAG